MKIRSTDETPIKELLFEKMRPSVPVGPAGLFQEDEGHGVSFSGLDQGECFKGLVHGAESPRKEDDRIGFLEEGHFSVEKVFIVDVPGVSFQNGVGFLFKGQSDVYPEGPVRSGLR